MTKKTMLETVFPNANTNNGVTFTEENINQDYKDGWRYIVWVGVMMTTTRTIKMPSEMLMNGKTKAMMMLSLNV